MSYWLYIPDKIPGPAGLPLVVMLHGCDQSATQFAQGTRMNRLAAPKGDFVLPDPPPEKMLFLVGGSGAFVPRDNH